MSHEEERVNGSQMRNKAERAPPHWLDPLVKLRLHAVVSRKEQPTEQL